MRKTGPAEPHFSRLWASEKRWKTHEKPRFGPHQFGVRKLHNWTNQQFWVNKKNTKKFKFRRNIVLKNPWRESPWVSRLTIFRTQPRSKSVGTSRPANGLGSLGRQQLFVHFNSDDQPIGTNLKPTHFSSIFFKSPTVNLFSSRPLQWSDQTQTKQLLKGTTSSLGSLTSSAIWVGDSTDQLTVAWVSSRLKSCLNYLETHCWIDIVGIYRELHSLAWCILFLSLHELNLIVVVYKPSILGKNMGPLIPHRHTWAKTEHPKNPEKIIHYWLLLYSIEVFLDF